ncbi:MAG: hypothetical protein OEW08_06250 [Gammaproteobacteria bacterium]|nr:hypothetical protein [Gammaproteobacteria bacterium]
MLVLGAIKRTVKWLQAGMELDLSPLPEDVNERLLRETTFHEIDTDGKPKVRRDVARYAQLVGRACIKGWQGAVDPQGALVACTPEAIDQFMLIGPAQDFVFSQVRSLALYVDAEIADAKNV